MAMQESVFSLRAYFGLVGILGLIRGLSGIYLVFQDHADLAIATDASISLFLGLGFLYSSIQLPNLLTTSTRFVRTLLFVTLGINAIAAVNALVLGLYGTDLIVPVVLMMVIWYLFLNVKRLEEEHGLSG